MSSKKRPLPEPKDKDTHEVCKKINSTTSSPSINQYDGWKVPNNNYTIPTISIGDGAADATSQNNTITPESFYNEYIRQRKPVVLRDMTTSSSPLLSDLSNLTKWKDINYLKSQVNPKQTVMVEQRSSCSNNPTKSTFGNGYEIPMTFPQFASLIASGNDDRHYLTTQDVHSNSDGRPDLMSPLMKYLQHDFPLQPRIMGNLIPQNINLWMGNSREGLSSGLHHDYHDNLYIVVKGTKRFRLYSPHDTEWMYTRGKLVKVHPNGRINYQGEETTAYGADLKSDMAARAAKRKEDAEKLLEEAERAVEEGVEGADQLLEKAEVELEKAMDDIIDAEVDDDDDNVRDDDDKVYETFGDERKRVVDKTVKDPNNFSKVKPHMLDDTDMLKESFPDFLNATAAYCTVQEGDILYLPASWFHEVTSYGGQNGHLAMNYWFHPPDGDSFEHPYSTDFWPNDYKDRFGK
eukprot:scaffold33699_cov167-Skeletonema_dohrnii-CCMP3373.AAC.3